MIVRVLIYKDWIVVSVQLDHDTQVFKYYWSYFTKFLLGYCNNNNKNRKSCQGYKTYNNIAVYEC